MICPVCKGKRFFKKLVFTGQPEDKGWEELAEPCENCDATGEIDALDNEEWFMSLSDTKKACFLASIVASGKKEYKQTSFWKKWLKQQHGN